MSTGKLIDYDYRSPGNPSGAMGIALSRRILAALIAGDAGKSICDLGCGNGYLAGLLTQAEFTVTGVDSSESGVAIARQVNGDCGTFLCRPVEPGLAVALGQNRFDAVVSSEVIEHLYRPRDLLETAFSILRPGGLLLLTTPYHGYLKNLAIALSGRFDAHVNPLWDGGHIKFFSRATLTELVSGSGFRDISFSYVGRAPLLWKSMVCTARKDDGLHLRNDRNVAGSAVTGKEGPLGNAG